jgi:ubiquinone/menaquinone biosynthesis C-methylase UbiE
MGIIPEFILYQLAKRWPSPVKDRISFGDDPNSFEYKKNYSLKKQYFTKLKKGVNYDFHNKKILEIGCGHGGISLFFSLNMAKEVVGVDINSENLAVAEKIKKSIEENLGNAKLPLVYLESKAETINYPNSYFDLIIAENVFEHFNNLDEVLKECHRILKPNGQLLVTAMPSIYSKYGLHLKLGLKLPWANLFWNEKQIISVLKRLAKINPDINKFYPGLLNNPNKIRDIRKYSDLNYITNIRFKQESEKAGFLIKAFNIYPTKPKIGKVLLRIPYLRYSILVDIFSHNSNFILEKDN